MKKTLTTLNVLIGIFIFSACTSGSNSTNDSKKENLTLSAWVYGLDSNEKITLIDGKNQKNVLEVTRNGKFTMPEKIDSGNPAQLTVLNQPSNQTCTVNGGNIISLHSNANFVVICNKKSHKVSVKVDGLVAGEKIKLINHGSKLNDMITVSRDGSFEFSQAVANGGAYDIEAFRDNSASVSAKSSSLNPTCQIKNGQGIAFNDSIIQIICSATSVNISADVTGLASNENLILTDYSALNSNVTVSSNGNFYLFSYPVVQGYTQNYNIEVTHAPKDKICTVDKPDGILSLQPGSNLKLNILCTKQQINSNYIKTATLSKLIGSSLEPGMYYTVISQDDINKFRSIKLSISGGGGGGGGGGSDGYSQNTTDTGGSGAIGGDGGNGATINATLDLTKLKPNTTLYWIVGSGGVGGSSFETGHNVDGNGGTGGGGGGASAIYYIDPFDPSNPIAQTYHYITIAAGGGGGGGGGGGHRGTTAPTMNFNTDEAEGIGVRGGNGGNGGNSGSCVFPKDIGDYSQKSEPLNVFPTDGNVPGNRNYIVNRTNFPLFFGPGQFFSGLQGGEGGYSTGTFIDGSGGGSGAGVGAFFQVVNNRVFLTGGAGGGGGGQQMLASGHLYKYRVLGGHIAETITTLMGQSDSSTIFEILNPPNENAIAGGAGGGGGSGTFSWISEKFISNAVCATPKSGGKGGAIESVGNKGNDGIITIGQ